MKETKARQDMQRCSCQADRETQQAQKAKQCHVSKTKQHSGQVDIQTLAQQLYQSV